MSFPPDPPWLNRQAWDTVWHMHLDRHERNQTALTLQQAEHQREHDAAHTAYERDRAEHAVAHGQAGTALDARLAEHQRAHTREHEMAQLALDKAEAANWQRFESVNEFRKTLTDQAGTFARTETMEARLQALTARLETTERNLNERRDTLGTQLGDRLVPLEAYKNSTQGQMHGSSATVAYVMGGMGMLIGLAGVVLHFIR